MVIKMIARQIREYTNVEVDASDPILHQRMGGNFHHY